MNRNITSYINLIIVQPLAPTKFQGIQNNYKVGDGRQERSNKQNAVDLVYNSAKKEETKFVKEKFIN